MARKANIEETLVIRALDLHAHDYIVAKNGDTLHVDTARRKNGRVTVAFWQRGADSATHVVPADYPVIVKAEHECECGGTGRFRWNGRVENGVYIGQEGPHYACDGKGWQDRSDVIRNETYWNKYARIHA